MAIIFYPTDGTYRVSERSIYAQFIGNPPDPCRKYHVSADLKSARLVATSVLPYLTENRIFHKVVANDSYLSRQFVGSQAGKFITIYMDQFVEQRNNVILELGKILQQLQTTDGIEPCAKIPRSRAYKHIFIEQPLDPAMFIYGGFIISPYE